MERDQGAGGLHAPGRRGESLHRKASLFRDRLRSCAPQAMAGRSLALTVADPASDAPIDVVVLAPHFDDAALSLGATVRRWSADGLRVVIVTMCGGAPMSGPLSAFAAAQVLSFDTTASTVFDGLVAQRVRIATMDLRIASIALSQGLTLLTRNSRDFQSWLTSGLRLDRKSVV